MPWPLTVLAVLAGLFALDRLLLALERGGYIYYRVRKPSGSGAGNALTELQQMLAPSTQHVIVAKREQRPEHNDDGGPPDPDGRPPRRDTLRQ
ncbi:hypothetical protein OV203_36580 [Nannocystis sp. ILAH1]|uniref:hypothetical protein n=1 Tax=unclassified Nannocystis TaxID=2627009 RepID=UPI00226FEC38|nr:MULTISPECIES: hypothetical protein [unclassified Nannocystis]MCY0992714.1 hypothetical protein [Nannocystis sp. ILAH1]MCY1070057.1 hypothetical protein [Nannocystis sp. RBIL2]